MKDNFLAADIAFGAAIAILFGILAANLEWNFLILSVVIFTATSILIFFNRAPWKIAVLFVVTILVGIFYYHLYLAVKTAQITVPFDKKLSFTAIVTDEPTPSDKATVLKASLQPPFSGQVMILAPPSSDFSYGDLLNVIGIVKKPDKPGGNPAVFSQRMSVLERHRAFWLREWLIGIKLATLAKFNEILPQEQAALLGGIAFGSKVNFSPELKDDMALSGTTHMVAISGYNITIIIISVGEIFGRLVSRRANFYLTLLFIILFILMSGIQASAIRAAIMGFIALSAREAGKSYDIRNSIVFTATAMALQDPTILLQDAGFQLSFLSLIGIVYLQKPLQKLFRYVEGGFLGWKENALTTLSAQLGVLPVLISVFGKFSATAIGANILVLGTVPLTMFFGFALAPLAVISAPLALFAGTLASFLLGYQLSVIKLFARLAIPLPITFNSALVVIFYYSLVAIFAITYGSA